MKGISSEAVGSKCGMDACLSSRPGHPDQVGEQAVFCAESAL